MKARKLTRPRWTAAEVKILKKMYRESSNAEIAVTLKRKVTSIVFKAHRMRLSKSAKRLSSMGRENIRHRTY